MLVFAMHQKQKIPFVAFCPFADHFCPARSAERQALELILSQNLIKLQTTDNQVQITT